MDGKIYDGDPAKFEHLIREGYDFNTREYISRGWEILSGNFGLFIGFLFVSGIISGVANSIPFVGLLISFGLGGPLGVSYYIVSRKLANDEPASFENFFDGFQDYVQLTLTYFLYLLFAFAPFLILTIYIGYSGNDLTNVDPSIFLLIGLLAIPCMYLGLAYMFALPIVYFEKIEALKALELSRKIITKRWFSFFLFFIVLSFIQILGVLALFVGVLFTMPLIYTSMYAAYEDIIGGQVDPLLEKIDEIGQEIKPEEFDEKF